MVDIVYERKRYRVTAVGHAGAGEHGSDPVCAAVSALICTLAAYARQLGTAATRLEPGNAFVALAPRRRCRPVAELVFDVLCGGLSLIARQYPDNVRYRVEE